MPSTPGRYDKSSKRQFLVHVTGIDGTWMTKTGGGITAASAKTYDGGDPNGYNTYGPLGVDNITLTRNYDFQRDYTLMKQLRKKVGKWRSSILVTPLDTNMIVIGDPTTYTYCGLVGFNDSDVDASSADPGTWSLEFTVGQVA